MPLYILIYIIHLILDLTSQNIIIVNLIKIKSDNMLALPYMHTYHYIRAKKNLHIEEKQGKSEWLGKSRRNVRVYLHLQVATLMNEREQHICRYEQANYTQGYRRNNHGYVMQKEIIARDLCGSRNYLTTINFINCINRQTYLEAHDLVLIWC